MIDDLLHHPPRLLCPHLPEPPGEGCGPRPDGHRRLYDIDALREVAADLADPAAPVGRARHLARLPEAAEVTGPTGPEDTRTR